jgi:hypothetical protein
MAFVFAFADRAPPEVPPVLMHELVVEMTDEHQVLDIGRSPVAPPHDVMRLREPATPTAWEGAPAIAMPHCTKRVPWTAAE